MIKHFNKNTKGRDFVVGDIHGAFTQLANALVVIDFDVTVDRLFSVGDLVDRGPESIDFDRWLSKSWFHAVRGNHEQMLIDAVADESMSQQQRMHHHLNGGEWLTGLPEVEQQCYAMLCKDLPLAIEVDTDAGLVGIVHAECPLDDWELFKSLLDTNQEYFEAVALWSRKRISSWNETEVKGVHKLYVGHTPAHNIRELGNVIYIDTGACFKDGQFSIVQIQ